jgi:hypothetical protein
MIEIQSQPAVVAGDAARIPAAVKAGQAVLHAVIQITRAGTGKVEEYTITGTPVADTQKEPKLWL